MKKLGIKTDKGKVAVDKFYQTNVAGFIPLVIALRARHLHTWHQRKELFVLKQLLMLKRNCIINLNRLDYNNVPGCTYCSPEIASVGFTEKQAKDAGYEVKVGKFPLSVSGKASQLAIPKVL